MEVDERIFQVDVLNLLKNAGWNPRFYSIYDSDTPAHFLFALNV